jgi:hypothetical protein
MVPSFKRCNHLVLSRGLNPICFDFVRAGFVGRVEPKASKNLICEVIEDPFHARWGINQKCKLPSGMIGRSRNCEIAGNVSIQSSSPWNVASAQIFPSIGGLYFSKRTIAVSRRSAAAPSEMALINR